MCPLPPAPLRGGQARSFPDAGTEVGVQVGSVFVDGAFLDEPLHPIAESALTLDEIAAKIAIAEAGLAAATTQYDRNVLAQIRDEYRRYAAERTKQIAKTA